MKPEELYFLPLGGAGEIGMNLNLYAYGGKWLMVDCGISFADIYLPGIDLIMPDPEYIGERKDDLLGLVLTHAHEDHLGAVAHLWPELRCPIYATPFTMTLLESKLEEAGLAGQVPLHTVPLGGSITLGEFDITYVSLTHSILEGNGLKISTPLGNIFHTGDWKLDPHPLVGEASDIGALKSLGHEGVLAIVCDSTNVFNEKSSGSEQDVRESLKALLDGHNGRLFVTTFASNIARVETLAKVGDALDRHVCLVGRSLKRNVEAAKKCGYLQDFPQVVSEEDAEHIPKDKILYICTGCQGEARAAMMRIATNQHRYISLSREDTVVFSSKIIPGNELLLARLHNMLTEHGVHVLTEKDHFVHVSGHPGQEELRQMYKWLRPVISVPVHGELRHMTLQAELAKKWGVEHQIVPVNGSLIRLAPGIPEIVDQVYSARLALDGNFVLPEDDDAIVMRRRIMYNGAAVVTVALDQGHKISGQVAVTLLGIADSEEQELTQMIIAAIKKETDHITVKAGKGDRNIAEAMRVAVRRICRQFSGKSPGPQVTVNIIRV
ncbi:MAG: hypothetical protein CMF31_10540 [Kordiimonas sp.]|nr:hypothetical protein [Kordiimonas sp.]